MHRVHSREIISKDKTEVKNCFPISPAKLDSALSVRSSKRPYICVFRIFVAIHIFVYHTFVFVHIFEYCIFASYTSSGVTPSCRTHLRVNIRLLCAFNESFPALVAVQTLPLWAQDWTSNQRVRTEYELPVRYRVASPIYPHWLVRSLSKPLPSLQDGTQVD